jgi:predicted alpha/beta hydrolase
MLGWIRTAGIDGIERDYYVRQLWDAKGSAEVETMSPEAMTMYATVCGAELARCHARAGDPIAIAAYVGSSDSLDRALAVFAEAYADQNERDYAALKEAVASGRVVARTGI